MQATNPALAYFEQMAKLVYLCMSNINKYYAHAFSVCAELQNSKEVIESIRIEGIKKLKEQHHQLIDIDDSFFKIKVYEHDRQNVVYDLVSLRVEINTNL